MDERYSGGMLVAAGFTGDPLNPARLLNVGSKAFQASPKY
jgi:hypothetical protein